MIGVFTHRAAVETDRVVKWLRRNDHDVVRVNLGQGESTCTLEIDNLGFRRAVATCDGRRLRPSECSSAWWHQFPPQTKADPGNEPAQALADSGRRRLWEAFARMVPTGAWLSSPSRITEAQNKLVQYSFASAAGLTIPKTLASCNPRDVRKNAEEFPILKALGDSSEMWHLGANGHGALTVRLDLSAVEDDDIAMTCGLYQEHVLSEHEVRAVVIRQPDGTSAVFAGSVAKPAGILDIRALPASTTKYETHQIPDRTQRSLASMLEQLDLRFCSADLVVRPDGEYVFLDLNATGAWWWIDDLYDRTITEALSMAIIGKPAP
jgi:hypothetical protein